MGASKTIAPQQAMDKLSFKSVGKNDKPKKNLMTIANDGADDYVI